MLSSLYLSYPTAKENVTSCFEDLIPRSGTFLCSPSLFYKHVVTMTKYTENIIKPDDCSVAVTNRQALQDTHT